MRRLAVALISIAALAAPPLEARPRPKRTRGSATRARPSQVETRRPAVVRPAGSAENVAPRGDTELERQLQDDLARILATSALKRAVNGVLVIDAHSGRVLFSFGADRQLKAASNVKLVATATALETLGVDFRWRTSLLGPVPDGDGVVHGDLYLVGQADPTLGTGGLRELAGSLAERGVKRVTGRLVVGRGGLRDTLAHSTIRVDVTGGRDAGDRPSVRVSPDSDYLVIDNRARTVRKLRRSRITVTVSAGAGRVKVAVRGRIARRRSAHVYRGVPGPTLFAGHTMRAALVRAGVEVEGGVEQADGPPDDAEELAVLESAPLAEVVARVNKPSNNFLADRVVWAAGAVIFGGEPTNPKGLRAMTGWLERLGIVPGSYRLDNGSGLSHTSHLSARQIVHVLLAGARDARFGAEYLASLAVGGVDGTLRRRYAGRPSAGHLRGKTGTLNGVVALSGFVSAGEEDTICFSMLENGFRNSSRNSVRDGQADMVDAMYRYLVARREARGAAAEEVAEAPAADAAGGAQAQAGEEDGAAVGEEGVTGEEESAEAVEDGEVEGAGPADGEVVEAGAVPTPEPAPQPAPSAPEPAPDAAPAPAPAPDAGVPEAGAGPGADAGG